MRVVARSLHGVTVLRLEGADALETATAPEVKRAALELLDGGSDAVLDLSEVEFLDSAGVGVLVSLCKAQCRKGRRLAFAGVGTQVGAVLQIIKLDRIFDCRPDVETAVRELNS